MDADHLLDVIAAHLDRLDAMIDHYARLSMTGTAARLRGLRDELEADATEPEATEPEGVTPCLTRP